MGLRKRLLALKACADTRLSPILMITTLSEKNTLQRESKHVLHSDTEVQYITYSFIAHGRYSNLPAKGEIVILDESHTLGSYPGKTSRYLITIRRRLHYPKTIALRDLGYFLTTPKCPWCQSNLNFTLGQRNSVIHCGTCETDWNLQFLTYQGANVGIGDKKDA